MANWANPTLASTYVNFVAETKGRDDDLALQFDGTTSSNIPTGAIRWNSGVGRWQKWSGTAWGELTSTYNLTGLTTTSAVQSPGFIPTSSNVPSNGMFLPSSNTLGWAINGSSRLTLSSTLLTVRGGQQIRGNSGETATLGVYAWQTAATSRTDLFFATARGTESSPLATVSGDTLGQLTWAGTVSNSALYGNACTIRCDADGAPSGSNLPGRFVISVGTTSGVSEALRINSSRQVCVGGTTPNGSTGEVYATNTARAYAKIKANALTVIRAFNVSSIQVNTPATQVFRVNFTTAMPSAQHTTVATCSGMSTAGIINLYSDGDSDSASYVDLAAFSTSDALIGRSVINIATFC